jgi:hypothetical protein
MIFVGRTKEIEKIQRSLGRGEHVIVTGKFGIGRTCLVHHVADRDGDRRHFIFTDFSKTARAVCTAVCAELYPRLKNPQDLPFKELRYKISRFEAAGRRRPVIVMDNIAALSPQKLDLVRRLSQSKQFLFIAVTEGFLKKAELDRLRGCLFPSTVISLSYLTPNEAAELVRSVYQQRYGKNPAPAEIECLVRSTHGYPLGMYQYFQRKRSV